MTTRPGRDAPTDAVQVPLRGRGRHVHPRSGGCLMELVGATTGGPWTDHPLCTPIVLAHVARTVNDQTSAQARPLLAPLIPYLITDPAHTDQVQADLATSLAVLAAAGPMLPADVLDTLTQQLHRVAHDAAAAARQSRRIMPNRRRHKFLAITKLALRAIYDTANPAGRDEELRGLLVDTINAERATEGLPAITTPPPPRISLTSANSITVLTRLVKPLGADWLELEVTVDFSRFPDWLSGAWLERQSELDTRRPDPRTELTPRTRQR
jgi:hypothetical protein